MQHFIFTITVIMIMLIGEYIAETVIVSEKEFATIFNDGKYICKKVKE